MECNIMVIIKTINAGDFLIEIEFNSGSFSCQTRITSLKQLLSLVLVLVVEKDFICGLRL